MDTWDRVGRICAPESLPEFEKRGVKLIGLSANTIEKHGDWIKDIDEISGSKLSFPIIGDKQRQVALLYDM